jgi:TPR repeat protein
VTKLTSICGVLCRRVLAWPVWADFATGQRAYESGDYATALKEWRTLAVQGHARAQAAFGVMYANGRGVAQDYAEAVRWFRKAAEQGHADAQFNLGRMYGQGRGVTQDDAEAVRWYRKAADQGHADAQFHLGLMYGQGQGVTQDYVEAHMWFNLAASRASVEDQKKYAEKRDSLARIMTAEQIAEAQRRAREWKPKTKP